MNFSLLPQLPERIDIEPTTKCNFRCVTCQRSYWNYKAKDMSLIQFEKILTNFPNLRKIKLQGIGEPLLNQYFFEMVSMAKAKNIEVTTFTNASLFHLNGNLEKLQYSGIDLLRISIDGGSKNIFEKTRQGSDFDQVVSNIRSLTSKRTSFLPTIEFWTVVTIENIYEIEKIITLAQSLNIKTVNVQFILNTFSYKKEIGNCLQVLSVQKQPEILKEAVQKAYQKANQLGINLVPQTSKSFSEDNPCHWPFDTAFINVEGYVVPCCTIADPRIINMGNLFSEPFSQIWKSQRYQEFRTKILSCDLIAACKNCYSQEHKKSIKIISNAQNCE